MDTKVATDTGGTVGSGCDLGRLVAVTGQALASKILAALVYRLLLAY